MPGVIMGIAGDQTLPPRPPPKLSVNSRDAEGSAVSALEYATYLAEQAQNAAEEQVSRNVDAAVQDALRAAGIFNEYALSRMSTMMLDLFGPDATEEAIFGQAQQQVEAMGSAVLNYVNNVLPGLAATSTSLFQQASATVGSLLSGEIPEDVASEIERIGAERYGALGKFRFANMTMRDIGKFGYEASLAGLSALPGVSGMANEIAGLYNTSVGMMSTQATATYNLGNLRNLLSEPYIQQMTNPSGLVAGFLDARNAATVISPDTVFRGALDAANNAMNADLASRELNLKNKQITQQQNQWQAEFNRTMQQNVIANALAVAQLGLSESQANNLMSLSGAPRGLSSNIAASSVGNTIRRYF